VSQERRVVIVVNRKLEVGRLLNVVGHLVLGLGGGVPDREVLALQEYRDADGGVHPDLSHHPVIVLKADNSNKLRTLRAALQQQGIRAVDFVHTMADGGTPAQLAATAATPEAQLEYFGVAFLGDRAELEPLTRKFSLFT
jgi:hypothetical protein